ncbi:MAG: replicative DNA helicase [Gammaproteobacteria bacterium]|nr:replicative DNA helicase [Gammaproteobacteria bacterium]
MQSADKIPAQSIESEQAILGSILLDNKSLYETDLQPVYFYKKIHAKIFRAMLELEENIDVITLAEQLKKNKCLDECGGQFYLTELAESVPSSAMIKHYAEIVLEKYNLRRLQEDVWAFQKMIDEHSTADEIYEKMGSCSVENIVEHKQFTINEILHETFDEIDRKAKGEIFGLTTGIYELDKYFNFEYKDLIVVAGYSSQAKTALCTQIVLHTIINLKKYVLFFELEMDRKRLAGRLLAMQAGVDSYKLWRGQLSETEWKLTNEAIGFIESAPLLIDDTPSVSLNYIRAQTKRAKQKYDVKMIIVDYLQLMETEKVDTQEQSISYITRNLKKLAKELNIIVILVSQFHRHEGTRFNRKPSMSDLKGSGAIEQDADKIILTWLPNLRKNDDELNGEDRYKAKLIVEKHREGAIGEIDLMFNKSYAKFE